MKGTMDMKTNLWLALLVALGLCVAQITAGEKDKKEEKEIKTDSGLKYVEQKIGTGKVAAKGNTVTVHYTGWLLKDGKIGKKFDSSRDRDKPFRFELGAGMVIKGWDEGVQGIKVGGKRKLIIPAELGYGNRDVGNGLIPAGSTLVFEVELLRVD
jgi:FKBP-type peptidyl-prolyl cis-trans isomerase